MFPKQGEWTYIRTIAYTLLVPEAFFRQMLIYSPRWVLIVYRLINAALIKFFKQNFGNTVDISTLRH